MKHWEIDWLSKGCTGSYRSLASYKQIDIIIGKSLLGNKLTNFILRGASINYFVWNDDKINEYTYNIKIFLKLKSTTKMSYSNWFVEVFI